MYSYVCGIFLCRFTGLCVTIPFVDPFYWAWLPMAEEVFSQEIKDLVMPKLESPGFIDSLQDELLDLFSVGIKKLYCIVLTSFSVYREIEVLTGDCFIVKWL